MAFGAGGGSGVEQWEASGSGVPKTSVRAMTVDIDASSHCRALSLHSLPFSPSGLSVW